MLVARVSSAPANGNNPSTFEQPKQIQYQIESKQKTRHNVNGSASSPPHRPLATAVHSIYLFSELRTPIAICVQSLRFAIASAGYPLRNPPGADNEKQNNKKTSGKPLTVTHNSQLHNIVGQEKCILFIIINWISLCRAIACAEAAISNVDATSAANERLAICWLAFSAPFRKNAATKDWAERNPKIESKCVRLCLSSARFDTYTLHVYEVPIPACIGVWCLQYVLLCVRSVYELHVEEQTERGQESEREYHIVEICRTLLLAANPHLLTMNRWRLSCLFYTRLHTHTHTQITNTGFTVQYSLRCVFGATISDLPLSTSTFALCFLLTVVWSVVQWLYALLSSYNWFIHRIASHRMNIHTRLKWFKYSLIAFPSTLSQNDIEIYPISFHWPIYVNRCNLFVNRINPSSEISTTIFHCLWTYLATLCCTQRTALPIGFWTKLNARRTYTKRWLFIANVELVAGGMTQCTHEYSWANKPTIHQASKPPRRNGREKVSFLFVVDVVVFLSFFRVIK